MKDGSITMRKQDEDLRATLDMLLQDLYIGRKNKLLNIELKYKWQENDGNILKSL
jgi:hypothetical protein